MDTKVDTVDLVDTTTTPVVTEPDSPPVKVRDKTAKKVLDVIQERGWTSESLVNSRGEVCLTGAALLADGRNIPDEDRGTFWSLFKEILTVETSPTVRRLGKQVPRVPVLHVWEETDSFREFICGLLLSRTYYMRIVYYNDEVVKNREQLVEQLERRAYRV